MYNSFLNYLKSNDPDKVLSRAGAVLRRIINPAIRCLAPLTSPYKIKIVKRVELPRGKPVIFAPTHGFKDDLLFTIVTISCQAYILFGSLPQFYHTFDGITAWLNGSIIVDRTDKESRKASKDKMKKAIELGANLIVFPEGVWNKTENLLVQKLFPGIYDVASATGAAVVPVATVLEGNIVYSGMGEEFDIAEYSREEGLKELRDRMCTLRYEIMEQYCTCTRLELLKEKTPDQYWNDYLESLISEVACYDREVENKAHFQEKGLYSAEEVFAPVFNLEVRKDTAFLFDKRIVGRGK